MISFMKIALKSISSVAIVRGMALQLFNLFMRATCGAGHSSSVIWGVGLDRLDADIVGSNPA
jgi:hypothetical protein